MTPPFSARWRLGTFSALRPDQSLDDGGAVTIPRPAKRIAPGIVGLGRARALGQQSPHHFEATMACGDHQRGHALLVLGVNLRSGVEQQFSCFNLVLRGGRCNGVSPNELTRFSFAFALIKIAMICRLPLTAA